MNRPGSTSSFKPLTPRRKGPQINSIVFILLAVVFVGGGLYLISTALIGPGKPVSNWLATDTPTPTVTYTPTNTSTPTMTATETLTPTITFTPTPSAPFQYTVQEGDYLTTIVEKFNLGPDGIALILLLNPYDEAAGTGIDPSTAIVYPGQVIWIPYPGMPLPTATPIPADLPRGTKLTYIVEAGDTLGGIAAKFNSTIDAIIKENKIDNPNALFVGQTLIIPANIVTPTATRPPTSTPATGTPFFGAAPTITPTKQP
jgi:LysM repeat protein